MSAITTHVLDIARGRPAEDVAVRLLQRVEGGWTEIASGRTDGDGRVGDLLPESVTPEAGEYRLIFATGEYHAAQGVEAFHTRVDVSFRVGEAREHYHVPVLLSAHGFTTYRGS